MYNAEPLKTNNHNSNEATVLRPVSVGIVGLGTVGSGTFKVLQRNAEDIARRAGRSIQIVHVGARRDHPDCDTTGVRVSRDIFEVARDPDVDILVELIGGTTTAYELTMMAIANGKHVVTANKALIALHGNEIFAAARKKGVNVAFEAAVAGGVPVIKAIREGLAANRILWLAGIINGTSNFILTEMWDKGRSFQDVLGEAQAKGYAEADPTFDVEGIDAAHKLTILASIAFGIPLQFDKVFVEGISRMESVDIKYAEQLGYRVKLLGITRQSDRGVELRVHPALIPAGHLMANVNGALNAVMVIADAVGPTFYSGWGAGSEPTASSVVADVIDVARVLTTDPTNRVPHLAFQADRLENLPILPIEEVETAFYLRILAKDSPGVLNKITAALSRADINIEAITQREIDEVNGQVPIIMVTRKIKEAQVRQAISEIEAVQDVVDRVICIRLEMLET
ncbi:Homoserine dehydrogenase [gamma proteobacterium HdN1]|nr:Homoserine dehydrogenase [gamma proteobacterium HdN1]